MSAPYVPEMGQMLFGAAFGPCEPGELGEACLQSVLAEIERVFWNRNQREWNRSEDPGIAGLAYRPYCWDECDCGRDEKESEWCAQHIHATTCYQTEYRALEDLPDLGNPHGKAASYAKRRARIDREAKLLCERHGIPWNDGRGSAVHCDCGYEQAWQQWAHENPHAATCSPTLPNLAFGDIEFRWYKHSRRGVTVQREVSADEWAAWLNAALAAVRACDTRP